jgi:IS5 family transposase
VDADNPGIEIIHRGRYKSLPSQQKRWLKRRQAIEPMIGHTKSDHRMDRCWLQGALGDALHALSCAAGYNIRPDQQESSASPGGSSRHELPRWEDAPT